MKSLRTTHTSPEDIARLKNDARKFFHMVNEARARGLREDPEGYARFIEEAGPLADEVREWIDL